LIPFILAAKLVSCLSFFDIQTHTHKRVGANKIVSP
jgi:hypothetical protein